MKVRDFFGLNPVQGDVGVEIEVEGKNLPAPPKGWRSEVDGSLKAAEALEFVMEVPVSIDELQNSLSDLRGAFKKNKSVFNNSYRAGIHVHVNVQDLSMVQLASMLTTYFIFEDSLVNFCDPFRKGNHFCLRARDAGMQVRKIKKVFLENNPREFNDDSIRYSSCNVCSVPKYGSLEFRSLESTDDFDKVYKFALLHHKLKEFAVSVKDPQEVVNLAYQLGTGGLCRTIFGGLSEEFFSQNSFLEDTDSGLEIAEDLAFCRKWGVKSLDIFAVRKEVF